MSSPNAQITMPAIELGPDLPDESSLTLDNVREQVKWRIRTDDAFSDALFSEAIQVLLADDMATAKTVLFDYIEATIGFDELARQSGIPLDLLLQMFGPLGDPRAADLFRVISLLQQHKGIQFEVSTAA
ncbi:transcriptional regulator [Rhizobium sp.]